MTTRDEIRGWLDEGVAKGATHVLVVSDTFSYDNYPVFVMKGQDVKVVKAEHNSEYRRDMQQVMEIYNLSLDLESQLGERMAWNY